MKYEIYKKGDWGSDIKPHPCAERRTHTDEDLTLWDIEIKNLADLKEMAKEYGPVALGYDGTEDVYYIQIG